MKAEKYLIVSEMNGQSTTKVRFGFGVAGEEVQKLIAGGAERVRVKIDGTTHETTFVSSRPWRLLDIKQRIKALSSEE